MTELTRAAQERIGEAKRILQECDLSAILEALEECATLREKLAAVEKDRDRQGRVCW